MKDFANLSAKRAPQFVYFCEGEEFKEVVRLLKKLQKKRRGAAKGIEHLTDDPPALLIKAQQVKDIHKEIVRVGNWLIDNVVKLEEDPDVQSYRLAGAKLRVVCSAEGEPHYIRLELLAKTKPGCVYICLETPPKEPGFL